MCDVHFHLTSTLSMMIEKINADRRVLYLIQNVVNSYFEISI